MNKATVESVMEFVRAVRVAVAVQIIEPCEANIGELKIADAALRAEVERLAAQAVPPEFEAPSGGVTWSSDDEAELDTALAERALRRTQAGPAPAPILAVSNDEWHALKNGAEAVMALVKSGDWDEANGKIYAALIRSVIDRTAILTVPAPAPVVTPYVTQAHLDRAFPAPVPAREVRLLTVDEVWHFALATADKVSPDESDEYPKVFAEVIQRAAFKANGLTIKEQS